MSDEELKKLVMCCLVEEAFREAQKDQYRGRYVDLPPLERGERVVEDMRLSHRRKESVRWALAVILIDSCAVDNPELSRGLFGHLSVIKEEADKADSDSFAEWAVEADEGDVERERARLVAFKDDRTAAYLYLEQLLGGEPST